MDYLNAYVLQAGGSRASADRAVDSEASPCVTAVGPNGCPRWTAKRHRGSRSADATPLCIIGYVELDSLWDFNDPAASEQKFWHWLAQDGLEADFRAEGLIQLARSQGLQRRFEDTHKTLDRAQEIIEGEGRAKVRLLLERGRAFNSGGDKPKALELFHEAAILARKVGEEGLEIDAMHMVAIADDPARSAQHNRAAIRRAEASHDPAARKWLASLNNNLGWSLFEEGKTEEALKCFKDAVTQREELGDADRLSTAQWCVGRALRELSRDQEALAIQESLFEIDLHGYVNEELAILYTKNGDERAAARAQKAIEMLGDSLEPERLATLKEIAK